jgi:hypothetical protein
MMVTLNTRTVPTYAFLIAEEAVGMGNVRFLTRVFVTTGISKTKITQMSACPNVLQDV